MSLVFVPSETLFIYQSLGRTLWGCRFLTQGIQLFRQKQRLVQSNHIDQLAGLPVFKKILSSITMKLRQSSKQP